MRKTIYQLFDEYILECEYSRKLRPETIRGYKETFKLLMKVIPDLTLETLTPIMITRFFKTLEDRKRTRHFGLLQEGIKKSTVRTYWSKLHNFFEWLRIRKYISESPFLGMRRPSVVYDNLKYLKKEEVEKIMTAVHYHSSNNLLLRKRNLALFYTLLFCGLRREELLLLQIRDIDMERKVLTVRAENSKIPRTRIIPLHAHVCMYLKDYLKERRHYSTAFLFVSRYKDQRLSYDGLDLLVKKIKATSRIKFHLHQFRHTFAVNFLKSSNNVVKLKQLMGHSDIRMTLVYLRCLPTHEMRADVENMMIDDFI